MLSITRVLLIISTALMLYICYLAISTFDHKVIRNREYYQAVLPQQNHKQEQKQRPITIFMATNFFSRNIKEFTSLDVCPEDVRSYCTLSSDQNDFEKADAVVFHARNYEGPPIPQKNSHGELVTRPPSISDHYFTHRNLSIPYIIFTMESPYNEQNFPKPPRLMNWTMSYTRSSDVQYAYGILKRKNNPDVDFQQIWDMKKPSKTGAEIAWIVSNCESPTGRSAIVKKMQKLGMKIDIFGNCGSPMPNCTRWANNRQCESQLMSPYKFYISLENSNCADYVTEKFWFTVKYRYNVPIVIGKNIYTDAGIPESSFIALDDFENLEEFYKFINSTSQNQEKYLEFHQWRKDYEVANLIDNGDESQGFCKICQKLQAGDHLKRKWHDSLAGKFQSVKQCNNSIGNRFYV